MCWRVSLSIVLIAIIVVVSINQTLRNKNDSWLCNVEKNMLLKSTPNNDQDIKPYMAHYIKDGLGVVIQCKKFHGTRGVFDSEWYEIVTIYNNSHKGLLHQKINLTDASSALVYTAVKKGKHRCLSYGKSGFIDLNNENILFSDIQLNFGNLVGNNERLYCLKNLPEKNTTFLWVDN